MNLFMVITGILLKHNCCVDRINALIISILVTVYLTFLVESDLFYGCEFAFLDKLLVVKWKMEKKKIDCLSNCLGVIIPFAV